MQNTKTRYMISFFMYYAMYAIVAPYLQIYLSGKGMNPIEIGWLLGMFEVAGIAGPFVLGFIADRSSRYRSLLFFCTLVSSFVLVAMLESGNIIIIAVLITLMGFVYKPMMPIMDSMISHSIHNPQDEYGHIRAVGSIGFTVVMIFFEITGIFNNPTPRMIAMAVMFLGIGYIVSILVIPGVDWREGGKNQIISGEQHPGDSATDRLQRLRLPVEFYILIALVFLGRLGFTAYYSFFSLYLQEMLHVENVGIFWMIGVIAEILPIMFSGVIIRFTGRFTAIFLGLSAMVLRLIVYGVTQSLWVAGTMQLLHGLTFGLLHAACINYINMKLPRNRKTMAMSIYISIAWGLAAVVGSPVGGFFVARYSYTGMYRLMAIFPAVSVFFLLVYRVFINLRWGWRKKVF